MSLLRRGLELASRGVILRRRLPERFGGSRAFVSPDASLRYWRPSLEKAAPDLFAWVDELVGPGDVVWDLGANLGLFSLASAQRAGVSGEVLAVEPDPWLCALVERSVAELRPGAAPVEVLRVAISDRDGSASLHVSGRGRAASHLESIAGTTQAGSPRSSVLISTRSLDSLALGRRSPTLVKIDIEGAECLALRGGRQLLEVRRPRLLVEVGTYAAAEIGQALCALGYRLFDAEAPPGRRKEINVPCWNTLALPAEIERTGR